MIIKGLVACVLFFNLRAHRFNPWVARSKKKFCNSPLGEGICKDITPLSLKNKFKSMSTTENKSKDDNNYNLVVGKQLSLCKHVGFTPFACFVCFSEDQSHYLWISFVFKNCLYKRNYYLLCVFYSFINRVIFLPESWYTYPPRRCPHTPKVLSSHERHPMTKCFKMKWIFDL